MNKPDIYLETVNKEAVVDVTAAQYSSGIWYVNVRCVSQTVARTLDWGWTSYGNSSCTFSLQDTGGVPYLEFSTEDFIRKYRIYYSRDKSDWQVVFVPLNHYNDWQEIAIK